MWDNPRLLNLATQALVALAACIFAYAGLQLLLRSPLFPLKEVVIQGELKNALRGDLESALQEVGGNFFAVSLDTVRARLERVPWVRRVELRRIWPDRLEAKLEEHVALARWGDSGLVNAYGETFLGALDEEREAALPLLAGPAGTAAEVTRRYRRFAELLAPLGETPQRITLSARHAWQVRLASGLQLELGRDGAEPVEARLARFVGAYPASLALLERNGVSRFQYVDLRYPNGFALRVLGTRG
jgi:cell division protein FtsQ